LTSAGESTYIAFLTDKNGRTINNTDRKGKNKLSNTGEWTFESTSTSAEIDSSGFSPPTGGVGFFITTIAPAPEASTWLLLTTALVSLFGYDLLSLRQRPLEIGRTGPRAEGENDEAG
jgi:hypothetical protein